MQRIPFNRTELSVTRLGLGLAALGRPGYINLGHGQDLAHTYEVAQMEAHAHTVLNAAYAAGIRYFDAARSYGRAEGFLASWLAARQLSPDQVTVGSKWGYTYTAEWQIEAEKHEVKEHSLAVLQRQWAESQANLGAHLHLYQIHSATLESGVLTNGPVLAALARLREAGVRIGLSVSGPQQGAVIEQALAVTVDGVPLFQSVQATWNLLERSAGPALAAAHDAGWGVIIKEALANGRLTPRNNHPDFAPHLARLQAEGERLGCTVDALALAGVLAQPWADVVLSGAATAAHIESNAAALTVPWDAAADTAISPLTESPQQYWQTRSNLTWN
jgi:aryl-alcohol dehydrogenase-like predicted oxidoreductase